MLQEACQFPNDPAMLDFWEPKGVFDLPGAPPMHIEQMYETMKTMKDAAFPQWRSVVHGVRETDEEDTFVVLTQQVSGPMMADLPPLGPFPPVKMADVDDKTKRAGFAFPVEVGTYVVNESGKIEAGEYEGETEELDGVFVTPELAEVWNKKGDFSDVGFGALFIALGQPQPAPPSKSVLRCLWRCGCA